MFCRLLSVGYHLRLYNCVDYCVSSHCSIQLQILSSDGVWVIPRSDLFRTTRIVSLILLACAYHKLTYFCKSFHLNRVLMSSNSEIQLLIDNLSSPIKYDKLPSMFLIVKLFPCDWRLIPICCQYDNIFSISRSSSFALAILPLTSCSHFLGRYLLSRILRLRRPSNRCCPIHRPLYYPPCHSRHLQVFAVFLSIDFTADIPHFRNSFLRSVSFISLLANVNSSSVFFCGAFPLPVVSIEPSCPDGTPFPPSLPLLCDPPEDIFTRTCFQLLFHNWGVHTTAQLRFLTTILTTLRLATVRPWIRNRCVITNICRVDLFIALDLQAFIPPIPAEPPCKKRCVRILQVITLVDDST